ncbi:MAG: replicative DNA helicase [Bdellovibrionaceae bacterium]|nr:replicative DNA helicase [Bdellovibrionales bacterium]MCB9085423.1 replicative DNA helicase [Pseudobdellovibrionaceae bacterium]
MDKKVPPQNMDAEKSILGGLLADPEAWDEIADQISEEDFYKPAHRKVFAAIRELGRRNLPADLVTVGNWLMEKGELEAIGGSPYLVELFEATPTTANITYWCKIVREKALLRKVIHSSQGFIEKAYDQDFEDIEGFLSGVESEVFALAEKKQASGLVAANDIVKASLEKLEELYAQKLSVTGVSSGWPDLDNLTSGFQPGELIIIAARPSMGKTALCLNVASHAALTDKKKVAFFSVEMGKESVMLRMLASAARISLSDLRVAHISDSAWPKLINAAATLSDSGLYIDDTSGVSPYEILAKCRRLKAKDGLDMIIVDYLQLMSLKQRVESREREVSEISKMLKAIAKELKVPVIALAQLNRGVEGRQNRRPMLSDLRESGSIEQDADVIMMIYREDYYEKDNPDIRGIAEIIIGKQRNGPTDTVKLLWKPEFGQFKSFEEQQRGPNPPPPESPSPGGYRRGNPDSGQSGASSGGPSKPRNFAPGAEI